MACLIRRTTLFCQTCLHSERYLSEPKAAQTLQAARSGFLHHGGAWQSLAGERAACGAVV